MDQFEYSPTAYSSAKHDEGKTQFLRKRIEKRIEWDKDMLAKSRYMVDMLEADLMVSERELQKFLN